MLEKIGQNLGKIFLGIVAIALFIFGYQCGKSNSEISKPVVTGSDTNKVSTHKVDSILPKGTVYVDKWHSGKTRVDTFYKHIEGVDCIRINVYDDTIRRPEFDITRQVVVQGKLRDLRTEIKLKVPLKIIDSVKTAVTITNTVTLTQAPKYQLGVGIIASSKMLAPMVDLSMDKWTYSAGYDPFNKQVVAGLKYRIISWTPKKKKK